MSTPTCSPGRDHVTLAPGEIRCRAQSEPGVRGPLYARVCPRCGRHFPAARGSAALHLRACLAVRP